MVPDPTFNTAIYIFGALLIAALGFGLLWLGSRMMRGLRFVFRVLFEKVRNWRKKAPAPAGSGVLEAARLVKIWKNIG